MTEVDLTLLDKAWANQTYAYVALKNLQNYHQRILTGSDNPIANQEVQARRDEWAAARKAYETLVRRAGFIYNT